MSSKYRTPAARRDEIETEIFADYEKRKAAGTEAANSTEATSNAKPANDAKPSSTPDANERMMWDALDTGIDPTEPSDSDER